jgi:ankyrin repeat protein
MSIDCRGAAVKCAAQKGHFEIVRALLANKASILEKDREQAIIWATELNHEDIIKFLRERYV